MSMYTCISYLYVVIYILYTSVKMNINLFVNLLIRIIVCHMHTYICICMMCNVIYMKPLSSTLES